MKFPGDAGSSDEKYSRHNSANCSRLTSSAPCKEESKQKGEKKWNEVRFIFAEFYAHINRAVNDFIPHPGQRVKDQLGINWFFFLVGPCSRDRSCLVPVSKWMGSPAANPGVIFLAKGQMERTDCGQRWVAFRCRFATKIRLGGCCRASSKQERANVERAKRCILWTTMYACHR